MLQAQNTQVNVGTMRNIYQKSEIYITMRTQKNHFFHSDFNSKAIRTLCILKKIITGK